MLRILSAVVPARVSFGDGLKGGLRAEEGSLYPALHRMEESGWIRAKWITKDSGRRARIYELTAAGKKQLAEEESRWGSVTAAVNRVLRTV
jgi:PadR family transcriptional regulator PadR